MSKDAEWVRFRDYPYLVNDRGDVFSERSQRLLSPSPQRSGYVQIALTKDGVKKSFRRSRVVLECFHGPCPQGKEAAHEDGSRNNDRLGNLEWKTAKENAKDRIRHGTQPARESHGCAKLSEEQISFVRANYIPWDKKFGSVALGERFGVTQGATAKAAGHKSWATEPAYDLSHAKKTECVRGHPLAGENLYVDPRGFRSCRICRAAKKQEWLQRQALSQAPRQTAQK